MFVVMAIDAEQFPIAAVRWVIVMIVIAVMHGKFGEVGAGKFTLTATANPRIQLYRLLTITSLTLFLVSPSIGNNFVQLVIFGFHACIWAFAFYSIKQHSTNTFCQSASIKGH